jgi:hypothetical protein
MILSIKNKLDERLKNSREQLGHHITTLAFSNEEFAQIFGEDAENRIIYEHSLLYNHKDSGILLFEYESDWYFVRLSRYDEHFYKITVSTFSEHIYSPVDEAIFEKIYEHEKQIEKEMKAVKQITSSKKFRLNTVFKGK